MEKLYTPYMVVLYACFLCSLIAFAKSYAAHMKLFSIFLGISVLTEISAILVIRWFHTGNHHIYNIYFLVEYLLYAFYFRYLIQLQANRKAIKHFFRFFPFVWAATTFTVFGLTTWNSYITLIGDAFTITLCVFYFYELFTSEELRNFSNTPEFWIAAATFIYCCCEVPIAGMLNFWIDNDQPIAFALRKTLQALNIGMYSIIIIAFLLPLFRKPIPAV